MPLEPKTMARLVFSQVAVAPEVSDPVFSSGWSLSPLDVIDDPFGGHLAQSVHRQEVIWPAMHVSAHFHLFVLLADASHRRVKPSAVSTTTPVGCQPG